MKYKHYHGFSKARKLLDDDPVLQGCRFESERRTLKEQFKTGEITKDGYDTLRRAVLFKHSRNGEASPIIKMTLNHGDLVVMHGESLQKYYEVCAIALYIAFADRLAFGCSRQETAICLDSTIYQARSRRGARVEEGRIHIVAGPNL